jgi:membrane protease YdiL (CAAX protease family)
VIAVVLLSKRRGVTGQLLGTRMPQPLPGVGPTSRAIRMAAMGMLAFLVGGIVTGLLSGGHHYQEPAQLSVPYLVYSVGGSLFSGVVEEMVALAFVVSTLRQARRPATEIVIVAVLLRCSYHVYYGAGIGGIAIWATVFALLYLRFRSVIPLIILHFLWDSFQFLASKWSAVASIGVLIGIGLVITAFILWIVAAVNHQHAKHPRPAAFAPYPGGPYPGPPYQGAPYQGQGAPYQGAPYPGAPYQGGPYQGAPYPSGPGAQYPGAPYQAAPPTGATGQPWPSAPSAQPWPTAEPWPPVQQPPAYPPPQSYGPPAPPGYAGPPVPPTYPPDQPRASG